tara:strand:- start:423 stop:1370 length:948 start_codon:yes stop_codon:yes gene_type:complete
MRILIDIGGTYARFALANKEGGYTKMRKYEAALHESFEAALSLYLKEEALEERGSLRIAIAGYIDQDVWKLTNKNEWVISPKALEQAGWDIEAILNDFEANVWAIPTFTGEDIKTLRSSSEPASPHKCLVGPGTGLGLGYLLKDKNDHYSVLRTHGGHMPAAIMSDEQWMVAQIVSRSKARSSCLSFEELVSGYGLLNLYNACCLMDGVEPAFSRVRDLPAHKDTPQVKRALKLFHEFFGQFAASMVITGHAYGGLYICGGVIERLDEIDLWDFSAFEKAFSIHSVEAVAQDLARTPIHHILEPTPALRGLSRYA